MGRALKSLLFVIVLCLVLPQPVGAAQGINVFYAGPANGLHQALALDKDVTFTDDIAQADVFFLNGAVGNVDAIRSRVDMGAGLVLILGPNLTPAEVSPLIGEPVDLVKLDTPLSLNPVSGASDSLLKEIVWTSAPQIRERFQVTVPGFTPLVEGFGDHSLVLGVRQVGQGRVFLLNAFMEGANPQIQEWAYFNYLVYNLAHQAGGQAPVSYADYPGSPVPHEKDQAILFVILGVILVSSGAAFVLIRRYSLAHPELLDRIVTNREEYQTHEAGTDWEDIGFHRPLAGFFMALFLGLLLFVPLIIYQNLILPVYILPSAQALGIWGRVTQFFGLAWTFFDMGTSVAFIKFLSQYRVHDPREGIKYGQVFVWWQAISGAVQVALVVGLAGTMMPHSVYAIYTWSVIIHTFIQIPGFYQVMRHALTGLQRFDFAQVLDLGLALIFPILTQPIFVTIMVFWGKDHPIFGPSIGGLLGMGLAAYAAELLTFVLGAWLYRRLGYGARIYFLAHFDWTTIKNSFRFGVFDMLGSAVWGIGQSLEILISQAFLVNYAEVWGNWVVAQNFVYGFNVISTLYNNLMPSISEAISHGRKMLARYYSAIAYKWGGFISAMLAAILLAVADRFILGATGPEFTRAAAYCIPLLIWGAVQYPSWVGDNVQRGSNHPWLIMVMVGLEQVIRIGLALLLLKSLQINALIIAYFVGLLTKGIVSYFANNRVCYKQSFYFWQSLAAPLLAGIAHYAVLRWVGGLIWHKDQVSSILMFFVAILPSYPLFAFFYGLFGGWDDDTLEEVHRAASLSSFMKPLAWLFWAASALGARISPLHGRFPMTIRAEAIKEARSLTDERVRL
jgi:O-antigen/teichoic acid export membrane protein